MLLHDSLLALANELSESEGEAYSRRAVSTAYYALFHRLAYEAAQLFFPAAEDAPLHAATVRALDHRTMKQVCQWFAGMATYSRPVNILLADSEVPDAVKAVSRTFTKLQEMRHEADYSLTGDFIASDAQEMCAEAQAAFRALGEDREDPVFRLFLGSLLFANSWRY